ncbi:hypothetical protein C7212DRAFT_307200 [Tuber magnatum]|uniref:Secreted protein n=1 Tax=Tuber magnatum TaxID=42249 RepID=A0A317T515_9PEZI|nr:hypothetical protein C7212DRAFT_307200 [Tuber magnatum]
MTPLPFLNPPAAIFWPLTTLSLMEGLSLLLPHYNVQPQYCPRHARRHCWEATALLEVPPHICEPKRHAHGS